jgi:pimeloyl-ACP methyl ester carboxylesterase
LALQQANYRLIRLYQQDGSTDCRFYEVPNARDAVLWLGGAGGGFDSPARGLYDQLATALMTERIDSLRVRYRNPRDLDSSIDDALVGIEFLERRGIETVAIVGHSFGGAVAIQAGAASLVAAGVATLASQSFGTSGANRIAPRPLLLIHGEADNVLPIDCSRYIYDNAGEPKELVIIRGAGHCFDEAADEVQRLLRNWLGVCLSRLAPTTAGPR